MFDPLFLTSFPLTHFFLNTEGMKIWEKLFVITKNKLIVFKGVLYVYMKWMLPENNMISWCFFGGEVKKSWKKQIF